MAREMNMNSLPILLPLSSASTLKENFKMSRALQRKGGKDVRDFWHINMVIGA